ncbi:MAG: M18 family aminopeptidase [Actinobacteria bacterium]|nr:M18 family aminopeptidase [Actinomycetota bacterium]
MPESTISSLLNWLDQCPTPFHVVHTAATSLDTSGFTSVQNLGNEIPTLGYITHDGCIVAWRLGTPKGALRIIGAHTDSPNLRVLPQPDMHQLGWSQLAIEIYGGVLLNSWLDRDLGIAGRVIDSNGHSHLYSVHQALARIPQLAIHLDREIGDKGLHLDRHQHMTPVWGSTKLSFSEWVKNVSGVEHVAAFDAHLFDITQATLLGADQSLLASGRLDNQASCWSAIEALRNAPDSEHTSILVLNDHEEVGSNSATGAAGPMLSTVVSCTATQHGLREGQQFDRLASSWCLSADNAHAINPNYPERHEPRHAPLINHGPAVKVNGNQRYATSARGLAHIRSIAQSNNIPLQTFASRNNVPCGSTIGPITATQLGIEAIDIGIPQLSMHSSREMCGANDPIHMVSLMSAFLQR